MDYRDEKQEKIYFMCKDQGVEVSDSLEMNIAFWFITLPKSAFGSVLTQHNHKCFPVSEKGGEPCAGDRWI